MSSHRFEKYKMFFFQHHTAHLSKIRGLSELKETTTHEKFKKEAKNVKVDGKNCQVNSILWVLKKIKRIKKQKHTLNPVKSRIL